MASKQEVAYHRTFLSPRYLDNFSDPGWWEKVVRRPARDVENLRLGDPEAFEEARKFLAQALKVPYRPGSIVYSTGDSGKPPVWVSGYPDDFKVAELMMPLYAPQGVARSPTSGRVALPVVGLSVPANAYWKVFHPIVMHQKMDQDFERYATPWELVWSNLSYPYNRGFTPVVDSSWKVIGHVGRVHANDPNTVLIIPKKLLGITLEEAMAREGGTCVHFCSKGGIPDGWTDGRFLPPEYKATVWTGLDGEVVEVLNLTGPNGLEDAWETLLDIVMAAEVMVSLAEIGVMGATSLVRKVTSPWKNRGVLRGATKGLAEEAEQLGMNKAGRKGPWFEVLEESPARIPGTSIPESLRIRVNNREFNVARNAAKIEKGTGKAIGPATKHMGEKAVGATQWAKGAQVDFPISSLAGALEEAETRLVAGSAHSGTFFTVEGWELGINSTTTPWTVYHAVYDPALK
jgi:hypothetical protein